MNDYRGVACILSTIGIIIGIGLQPLVQVATAESNFWRTFPQKTIKFKATSAALNFLTCTKFECTQKCQRNEECSSFAYNNENGNCTLNICGRVIIISDLNSEVFVRGMLILNLILNHMK